MTRNIYPEQPVLIVDDEEHFLLSVEMTLRSNGINNLETCSDSRKVLKLLKNNRYSLVSLDINMPHLTGLDLLQPIVDYYPDVPVIMLSAVNEVEKAVSAMKMGAFDYIVKPVHETRLVSAIRRAIDLRQIRQENSLLKHYLLEGELENPDVFSKIITRSKSMEAIFKYCEAIGRTNLPVLITGETGVGKELIAQVIHTLSRRSGQLVTVNVAGVDDTLFSDTLFGHKKGAFTGAEMERKGLLEQSQNGTIFLDEIGDLRMESQVKLLRLLQDGSYYPIGSDIAKLSNARVVVATHRDIKNMQSGGNFRQDLYYRLQAHHIHIPALRERKNDIPLLVDHFLRSACRQLNKKPVTPPKELYTLLSMYNFPGNIRELEGMIFNAVSMHKSGILSMQTFKEKISIQQNQPVQDINHPEESKIAFGDQLPTLKEIEELLIGEALKRSNNNQALASDLLGITRRALNNRLRRSK